MRTEVSTQETEARNYDAAFSPDGTKIAFTSYRNGNSEIYMMNARDGSKQQNRTKNAAYDFAPDWGGLLLELARIGSLLFIFVDSPSDQIGSSAPIDIYATRLSAQPVSSHSPITTGIALAKGRGERFLLAH